MEVLDGSWHTDSTCGPKVRFLNFQEQLGITHITRAVSTEAVGCEKRDCHLGK